MSIIFQNELPLKNTQIPKRNPPPQTLKELLIRARMLNGYSIGEIANALNISIPTENKRAKGFIGQIIERALGTDPKARDNPDFTHLGVELKTIPIKKNGFPMESTFCCSIKMDKADQAIWETSRLKKRLSCVLFIPIEFSTTKILDKKRIGSPVLWKPDKEEKKKLRSDWEDLMGMIGAGFLVDGYHGEYLQVRPKAKNSSTRILSLAEDGVGLKIPLAFYLRTKFTVTILNKNLDSSLSS